MMTIAEKRETLENIMTYELLDAYENTAKYIGRLRECGRLEEADEIANDLDLFRDEILKRINA